jgi:hypothetical protein
VCDASDPRRYRPFSAQYEADRSEVRVTIAIIVVLALVIIFLVGRRFWVPSRNKKCSRCGERTPLKSEVCEHCGHAFHVR